MMGAFHYRPIDPGYAQAGAGVARGIDQGIANFQGGKDRTRRRLAEDRQNEIDQVRLDIMLGEAGGGRGPIPNDPIDLPDAGSALNDQTGLSIRADAPTSRPRPGMIPVGPEGFGYIEDPEHRSRRLADEEYRITEERGAAERARIGAAGTALIGGRAGPDDLGTIIQNKVSIDDLLGINQPRGIDEFEQEEAIRAEHDLEIERARTEGDIELEGARGRNRMAETEADRLPTFKEAYDIVSDLYADRNAEGYKIGYKKSDAELTRMAKDISEGRMEIPAAPGGQDQAGRDEPWWAGGTGTGAGPVQVPLRPGAQPVSPARAGERERTPPPSPEQAPAQAVTDEEIPAIREALARFPQRRWEQILRDEGVSEEDIARIVGR